MPEMTIADFINQTTPGHICPFCGTRQWVLLGERGLLMPNTKGEFTLPADIDKAFMTECSGCGFVRLIRPYNLIQRVINAQKAQAEKEEQVDSAVEKENEAQFEEEKVGKKNKNR